MPELILMQGYPASGKSTVAKAWVLEGVDQGSPRARVSRDDIRESLFGRFGDRGNLGFATEQHITDIQQDQVRKLLKRGYDVVVDDMNLRRRYCVGWAEIAHEQQVRLDFWRIETPVDVCRVRDHSRFNLGGRNVGADAITEIAKKFPITRWPDRDEVVAAVEGKTIAGDWRVYKALPNKPRAIIVDLDGTVALKDRAEGSRGWHEYDRVGEDLPNPRVIEMVNLIHEADHADILFLSGRKDSCRTTTRDWLHEHVGPWTEDCWLWMRRSDDNRSDDIVKHELFDTHIRDNYDVVGAFDDRDRVVAMWRAIGLQVYQVADGNF